MIVHHDIRTEPIHEVVPAPRTLANWIPMKPVPTWPAVTTTVGFEVQERPLPADLHAGPSNDRDRANLSHDNEKGLNVVKLQVAKASRAYAPLEHWSHLTAPWSMFEVKEQQPSGAFCPYWRTLGTQNAESTGKPTPLPTNMRPHGQSMQQPHGTTAHHEHFQLLS